MQLFVKKTFYLIVLLSQATATWLENIPQKITQSNGQIIEIYASGDQYSHRLHDENDYTIVLNPTMVISIMLLKEVKKSFHQSLKLDQ